MLNRNKFLPQFSFNLAEQIQYYEDEKIHYPLFNAG